MTLRNELRNGLENKVRESLEPKDFRWLGRQDSNLRMPVPKTGRSWPQGPRSLRNDQLIHKRKSMAYAQFAECLSPHRAAL